MSDRASQADAVSPEGRPRRIGGLGLAALVVVLLVAALVLLFVRNDQVFRTYSHDFGSLSPARFRALNDEMDWLSRASGLVLLVGLLPADLLLFGLSLRARARGGGRRSTLALILAIVVGLLCALLLLAGYAVPSGGGMIG